ncbi:etoposide-induced protein 2.4-domain-containing protein [Fomitopsis serialis]|uniref:etoposide-induced protein 2.4-domain-containing protein n=1 Tax=Fomitopsis serialis TaxID=139415 RepID=UPI0020080EC0|nr:etoposide-induced protein 2.4-domain-containing protein [Neoantrodia serialis]KAH9930913.1 etoposide-induced protein 2.4-domain-containing protein [Neoantrodia serialis]
MSRSSHRAYPISPSVDHSYAVSPSASTFYTSRSSYPNFLPLQDTIRVQFSCAWRGLVDAFRWDTVVRLVASDSEIRGNVLKSLLLNLLSLASIYLFDLLLFPLAQGEHYWLHRNVGWAYQVLWLLPVVGISLYLNRNWCGLIAKRTFTLQHGPRAGAAPPSTYTGLLNSLATSAYGGIMVMTSLVLSLALGRVPVVGSFAGFTFFCWVDAHVWITRGLSLSRRVRHLEERWAYYWAFGLPSTALCMWGSSLANAALFALVFPAVLHHHGHARPSVPLDPYNPAVSLPPSASSSTLEDIRHPHPAIPIRLPIFALILWLNDWVVRLLSLGGGRGASKLPGVSSSVSRGHRRMFSEAVDSMEEGDFVELSPVVGPSPQMHLPPSGSAARMRVSGSTSMGSAGSSPRRKRD